MSEILIMLVIAVVIIAGVCIVAVIKAKRESKHSRDADISPEQQELDNLRQKLEIQNMYRTRESMRGKHL